jgi:hypothetical protein
MKRVELAKLLEEVVTNPAFQPEGKTTKCNFGVQRVAFEFEYSGFAKKMANDICDIVIKSPDWGRTDPDGAAAAAWNGLFVIAAQKGKPNGHVATVYPGGLSFSGKWQKNCPLVANVGKKNWICKASEAFVDEPEYFIYTKVG